MTTPELLDFIKQQLAAGKSHAEISGMLEPHGWATADIAEGFDTVAPAPAPAPVAPVMPEPAPTPAPTPMVEATPAPVVQPIIVTPVQPVQAVPAQPIVTQPQPIYQQPQPVQSQPVMRPMGNHSFKNPNWVLALLSFMVASIVGAVGFSYIAASRAPLPASANTITLIFLGVSAVAILFGAAILKLTTRIFSIPERSYAKAVVFISMNMVVGMAIAAVATAGASWISILGLIIWFVLFCWYYQVTFLKALGVFVLDGVLSAIIGIVLAIIASAIGLGIFATVFHHSSTPLARSMSSNGNVVLNAVDEGANKAAADAASKSLLSQIAAFAELYSTSALHNGTYGASLASNFCNDQQEGVIFITAHMKLPVLNICTVASKFPAKTYTVVAASAVTPGSYFCVDSTIASPVTISSLTAGGYVAGKTCGSTASN